MFEEYALNLRKYNELCARTFDAGMSKDEVIEQLMEISTAKREIQNACNRIIQETIVPLEAQEEPLTEDQRQFLVNFGRSNFVDGNIQDYGLAERIDSTLLRHYLKTEQYSKIPNEAFLVLHYRTHRYSHGLFTQEMEDCQLTNLMWQHLDEMDAFGKKGFFTYLCQSIYNPDKIERSITKALELNNLIERLDLLNSPDKNVIMMHYLSAMQDAMVLFSLYMFKNHDPNENNRQEPINPEMFEGAGQVYNILKDAFDDPVKSEFCLKDFVKMCLVEFEFFSGKISLEKLQQELLSCVNNPGKLETREETIIFFTAALFYIENLFIFGTETPENKKQQGWDFVQKVESIYSTKNPASKDYNRVLGYADFITIASRRLGFELSKDIIADKTVYGDKALYIHTLMVNSICNVILEFLMEHNPLYFEGVAGLCACDIVDNDGKITPAARETLCKVMKDSAMFHDIGKFYCLDYVSNSSRDLTENEYKCIKCHPENFDKFFGMEDNEYFKTIRDCAVLHHRWYDESAGYPALPHTNAKPIVNILSIADSLDAATDFIGRPYAGNKKLEMLVQEFQTQRNTRYSGIVIDALKDGEVLEAVQKIITKERLEINYRVMTEN